VEALTIRRASQRRITRTRVLSCRAHVNEKTGSNGTPEEIVSGGVNYFSRRTMLSGSAAISCLATTAALVQPALAEVADFVLFESGKTSPVPCLKAINPRKMGATSDLSNFEPIDPIALGAYTIKNVEYSFYAPATFRPLTGHMDGASPDPTGTLDMRLEDPSLGTIIVASPQKKNAPWKGKTSIVQVGTPEQALAAFSSAKLLELVVDSQIRTGPTGQVYYTYELCFKSPPAVHRLFCLSVADGELIVLTLICGGNITNSTNAGKNETLWDEQRDTFFKMASSFRVAEPPAKSV